jgi:putative transposase
MSRRGDCYDNTTTPVAESLFSTLKMELVYRTGWCTRIEARIDVHEYIEVFYNRQRRHSSLGYRTPVVFEQASRGTPQGSPRGPGLRPAPALDKENRNLGAQADDRGKRVRWRCQDRLRVGYETMNSIQLSSMEIGVLAVFHELYRDRGFPPPAEIRVRRRENTGSGRYVEIEADADVRLNDGYVLMGEHFIEMTGVPNGMMAAVRIRSNRIDQLELAVYGHDSWDGEERQWSIV